MGRFFFVTPDNSEARFDPIPENRGQRGWPAHMPVRENCNNTKLLLTLGWTDTRIT